MARRRRARPCRGRRRPAARARAPAARCARRAQPGCRASRGTRCASNFVSRSSSGDLRSVSQKKFASDEPRADHPLIAGDDRLPAVGRLDIGDEDEAVGELAGLARLRSTKHFWFLRMVVRITSAGIDRNAASNAPISTTGHSTRPATSASRPRPRPVRSPARRRGSWPRSG